MSSTSPTSSTIFPRSHSPTKNAHPYAIKTTSTAVLSGGSSGSHSFSSHSYVPPSPSPSPSRSTMGLPKSGSRHRYSRSLTSDLPRPLPAPPSYPSPSPTRRSEFETPPPGRTKRADTLPSFLPPTPLAVEELPPNPKVWTPSQLSSYLSRALRPFVRKSKITGRIFLRFEEDDLEKYDINKPWRTALLAASRTLRQNILQGQIWGFPPQDAEHDEDGHQIADHTHLTVLRHLFARRSDPDATARPLQERARPNKTPRRSGSMSSSASSDYHGEDDAGHWAPNGDSNGRPLPLPPHPYPAPPFPNATPSPDGSEFGIAYYSQRPLPDRPIIYPVYFGPEQLEPSTTGATEPGPVIRAPAPSKPEEPTIAELLETSSTGAALWEMDPGETARRLPVAPKHPEEELSMEDLLLEVGGSTVDAWERDTRMGVTAKRVEEVQSGRLTQEALREFESSHRNGKAKTRSGRRDINDIFGLGGGADPEQSVHGERVEVGVSTDVEDRSTTRDVVDVGVQGHARDINDIFGLGGGADPEQSAHGERVEVGVSTDIENSTTRDVTDIGVQGHACNVIEVGVGQDAEQVQAQMLEQEHIDRRFEDQQKLLEQSLLETRKMVQIFKERLQDVERKVEGMEQLGLGREVVEISTGAPAERRADDEPAPIHPKILLSRLLGRFFRPSIADSLNSYIPLLRKPVAAPPPTPPASSLDRRKRQARLLRPYGYTSPRTLSALPTYVLIVGIGVCAVVLRVVLRKSLRGFRR
ncbi:hypothetical protein BD779DRAFT_1801307 [Infundibulicybe gibba]|nr:hypothetical protein BD779DRAFT_1801307 [Infundibulicybe gibba]